MPYTPVHPTENSVESIRELEKSLEEARKTVPKEILSLLWQMKEKMQEAEGKNVDEIEQILRYFREREPQKKGSGGGGSPAGSPIFKKSSFPLCNVIYESELLDVPTDPVRFSMWSGQRGVFLYKPVRESVELLEVLGHIWVEGHNERIPYQFYIRMLPVSEPMTVQERHLLGFFVGFERYAPERGKFFLDILDFPQESSEDPPTLLANEIPTYSRKFRSTEIVLNNSLLSAYMDEGLRFKCDLTVFAEAK